MLLKQNINNGNSANAYTKGRRARQTCSISAVIHARAVKIAALVAVSFAAVVDFVACISFSPPAVMACYAWNILLLLDVFWRCSGFSFIHRSTSCCFAWQDRPPSASCPTAYRWLHLLCWTISPPVVRFLTPEAGYLVYRAGLASPAAA